MPLLSQATLNIDHKVRSNLFAWRGQFSPQLVEAHLAAYAGPDDLVLDPFVGSGTVLVECARRGNPALGAEVNPAAAIMARTYEMACRSSASRAHLIAVVEQLLARLGSEARLSLFSVCAGPPDLSRALTTLAVSRPPDDPVRHLLETLVITLDLDDTPLRPPRLSGSWSNLRRLIEALPETEARIRVALADARALPCRDSAVDFVFTSPPYINVFNYHQQYRRSVEELAWHVLPLARSEIGSNRKHRGNRFLTVIQYCLDMAQVLAELARVCKPGARAVFVIGRESNVRKTPFYNGEILLGLAESLQFRVALQQERVFRNRFGRDIHEDIIHLETRKPIPPRAAMLRAARAIARDVLTAARTRAPSDSRPDLDAAIAHHQAVEPSPVARPSELNPHLAPGFAPSLIEPSTSLVSGGGREV